VTSKDYVHVILWGCAFIPGIEFRGFSCTFYNNEVHGAEIDNLKFKVSHMEGDD